MLLSELPPGLPHVSPAGSDPREHTQRGDEVNRQLLRRCDRDLDRGGSGNEVAGAVVVEHDEREP